MTEEEARALCAEIAGLAMPRVDRYRAALLAENARQNLIARSTEDVIWRRHLLDSLQLARFARGGDATWLDVGSGAGLPGLALATLGRWRVTLVEPRKRRAEFLRVTASDLDLNVVVIQADVRGYAERHDIISARAVADVDTLFALTAGCYDRGSRFVLPKGRSAREDVDAAGQRWHGSFHVEQSLTDQDAGIVIADAVSAR